MFLIKVEIQIPIYLFFLLFTTQNVAKFCSRQFLVLVLRLLSFFLFSEHRVILLLSKNKLLALGVHKPLTFL